MGSRAPRPRCAPRAWARAGFPDPPAGFGFVSAPPPPPLGARAPSTFALCLQAPRDRLACPSSCGTAPPSPSTGPAETPARGPSPATSSRPGPQVRPARSRLAPRSRRPSSPPFLPPPSAPPLGALPSAVTRDGACAMPGKVRGGLGEGELGRCTLVREQPGGPQRPALSAGRAPAQGRRRSRRRRCRESRSRE